MQCQNSQTFSSSMAARFVKVTSPPRIALGLVKCMHPEININIIDHIHTLIKDI